MSTIARLALIPRDGIFCKDGRGWHTSSSGRGHGLDWPWPSTILGALRSIWGWEEEDKLDRPFKPEEWLNNAHSISLGRSLILRRGGGGPWSSSNRVWPVPSDALTLEGRDLVYRLEPIPPKLSTLGIDDDDARESLWMPEPPPEASKPLSASRWWSEDRFVAWLSGRDIPALDDESVFNPVQRVQTHVSIHPETMTADEGVLFSHDVLETLERQAEWAIAAEVEIQSNGSSDHRSSGLSTLGADQRLMLREPLQEDAFAMPQVLLDSFVNGSLGLRLVVVTPACFERGWLPDGLEARGADYRGHLDGLEPEVILRAAIVPRPIHVSGWDMVHCRPKPTSRMVAPGTTYFFERADGARFAKAEFQPLWLGSLGTRNDEGFGRVVPGIWSPVRTKA